MLEYVVHMLMVSEDGWISARNLDGIEGRIWYYCQAVAEDSLSRQG